MAKNRLLISIFALISTLAFCVISVFAWFYVAYRGTFQNFTMAAVKALNVDVSTDNGTWTKEQLSFSSSSYAFSHLSGNCEKTDGSLNLVKPLVDDFGELKMNGSSWSLDTAPVANTDYIEMTVYVRSNLQSAMLSLGSDTRVYGLYTDVAQTPQKQSALGLRDANGFTTYGTFSKDNVCAAARMSVSKVNADGEQLLFVWAPNDNVRLRKVTANDSYVLYTSLSDYQADDATYEDIPFAYAQDYTAYSPTSGAAVDISDAEWFSTDVADFSYTFSASDVSQGYYVACFVFRVWIEGTDPEANSALGGGQIGVSIELTAKAV